MRTPPAAALALACLVSGAAAAAPPGEPVSLWPKVAPGSEGKTGPEKVDTRDGVRRVSSIHRPSLTPHLPAKGTGNGAAVIILPGGGHRYLAIDNEGHPVASWLSDRGVAAFVLKYRLAREEGATYKVEQHALWDAQRALRLVRSRAKQWGIDPARVGLLGFSAGGQVTSYAAARFDAGKPGAADPIERESSRPAFQGLMYAGAAPPDVVVPKDAPPAFLLTAADDKNPTQNALGTFQKLREAGIEAELHVYARGGHGFGLKPRPLNVTHWPDRFYQWLDEQGFLKPLPPPGTAPATPAPTAAPPAPPAPAIPPKAATPAERELDQRFAATVKPFVDKYCTNCHGGDQPKADLDLRPYGTLASVAQDFPRWSQLAEKLHEREMPPKKSAQPSAGEQQQVMDWIAAVRTNEARKHAGDPGTVLARRLSNAEYNNTIRDLTGVDIRPTREFPVDPANTAGFDNSGESLAMSPALLKKYLDAAREVANHLVLESEGLAFAPHPMLVETDRDKYCVQNIVDFYKQQNTDLAAYFQAAWRFRHRSALGQPRATLASLATERQVSARYLATVWRVLEQEKFTAGPMARLQAMWRELPAPKRQTRAVDADALVRPGATAMRDYVVKLRKKLEPRFTGPAVAGLQANSQPLAMWRNRQYATHRMTCDREALQLEGKPLLARATPAKKPADEDAENDEEEAPTGREERQATPDRDLAVPAAQQAKALASFDRFCAVFPDTFYVAERGRNYQDKTRDRGRLLSAGFHNLMGYFRDDQPLYQLLLDPAQQKQLDRLWRELDFVADATRRTYLQFYFSGAATTVRRQKAPDAARPADGEVTSQPAIEELQKLFLARVAPAKSELGNQAIREHFGWVNTTLRSTETAHTAAEPKHLQALLAFAARAYRRPLTDAERDSLLGYYKKLRAPTAQGEPGLGHEDAVRDLLVSVLMSPDFCYRVDLVPAGGTRPLSDHALASRLSYFLWSSTPDAELLAHARAGDLHRPKVLAAQARRMLKDPKARGLATEFGGSWLDFRRFEEHNAVDRERFTSFTSDLRSAMFEEPVRFLLDVFRNDRSVLDLLYADHTFVNPVLARHYGIPLDKDAGAGDWVRVPDAARYGRGGLLPMAVFLTKNAPGLRTSPVKRGYWVVRNVLGERIPPPPAVVPELPRDEAKLELPLRELLAKHREDPACSGCHARFDSLGLVFEGYGPIGEQRAQDLAGRPVDAKASFPGGSEGTGLAGLRAYLRGKRQDDFVDNLTRKLLAFGLGRTLVLSDEPAVAQMKTRLAKSGFRFDTLVESVVLSPQFLTKRGRDAVAAR